MGIQGVTHAVRGLTARALAELEWTNDSFTESMSFALSDEKEACERVESAVNRIKALGAPRREYSLVSKVLHWLTPWRIPVYDGYVRNMLYATGRDHESYAHIVRWEFTAARQLLAQGSDWITGYAPTCPLRILDKYLWWKGGGEDGCAVVATDPWRVAEELGIPRQRVTEN